MVWQRYVRQTADQDADDLGTAGLGAQTAIAAQQPRSLCCPGADVILVDNVVDVTSHR